MKKLAFILVSAIILSALLILCSCETSKTDVKDTAAAQSTNAESAKDTKDTAKETVSDTAKETVSDTAAITVNDTDATGSGGEDTGDWISDDSIYADIWGQTAIIEAIDRIGADYMCVGTEKGATPDGLEAWIISLRRIDDENAPVWKCYVSGAFCYLEEGAPDTLDTSN